MEVASKSALILSMFFIVIAVALAMTAGSVLESATEKLPWDGAYTCNPGSAYTTAECP